MGRVTGAEWVGDGGHHRVSHAWPQRLVDRLPDLVQPEAITVDHSSSRELTALTSMAAVAGPLLMSVSEPFSGRPPIG